MKKILSYLMVLVAVFNSNAETNLIISNIDGSSHIIALNSHPKVRMTEDKLFVDSDSITLELPTQKIKDFKFSDGSSTSANTDAELTDEKITIGRDILVFPEAKSDGKIQIFDIKGLVVKSADVAKGESITIHISDLEKGVYVVTTANLNIKFYKQ